MLPELPEDLENLPKLRKYLDALQNAILEGGLGGGDDTPGASTQLSGTDSTSSDDYTTILSLESVNGLMGQGTLINTDDTNTLTIQESVIDAFGNDVVLTTEILPGDTIPLDLQINLGSGTVGEAFPPYLSYLLEVKSTTALAPATFEMRFTGIYI